MKSWMTCHGFVLPLWSQPSFSRPSRHVVIDIHQVTQFLRMIHAVQEFGFAQNQ
jgi:hypothetical protein